MTDQYAPGEHITNRPAELVDAEHDTWVWTDADRHGVPGYQWAGGATHPRISPGVGPAHTYEYVTEARYCHAWRRAGGCDIAHHQRAHLRVSA